MKKILIGIIMILGVASAVELDKVKVEVLEARFTSFESARAIGIGQDLANIKRWFTLAHQEILEYLDLYDIGVLTKESFERLRNSTSSETMSRICTYIPYIEEAELPYLDHLAYYEVYEGEPKGEHQIGKFLLGKDTIFNMCGISK